MPDVPLCVITAPAGVSVPAFCGLAFLDPLLLPTKDNLPAFFAIDPPPSPAAVAPAFAVGAAAGASVAGAGGPPCRINVVIWLLIPLLLEVPWHADFSACTNF
jgi:hypothetical protein